MARGVLKWFNHVSDYGFIACDEGGPDHYLRGGNVTGPSSELLAGSRVEFDARQGGMGREAINVRRLTPMRHRSSGSFEPSRRHGPFDPRFRRRSAPGSFVPTSRRLDTSLQTNQPAVAAAKRLREAIEREAAQMAVQRWESEGGAVARVR
jgi:CspA family cold shock protein